MPTSLLRPGEFVEVISYDIMVTGLGFGIAASILRLVSETTPAWKGLIASSVILGGVGLFLWRLSSSIQKRWEKLRE